MDTSSARDGTLQIISYTKMDCIIIVFWSILFLQFYLVLYNLCFVGCPSLCVSNVGAHMIFIEPVLHHTCAHDINSA